MADTTTLPSPELRWSPQRKAALLLALDYALLSEVEIGERFWVSSKALTAWRRDLGAHGVPGLRSTRLQIYHDTAVKGRGPITLQARNRASIAARAPALHLHEISKDWP